MTSHDEREAVALDLLAKPGTVAEELEIGPFEVRRTRVVPPDEVYFIDNGSMFTTTRGWVYSPTGTPSGFSDFSATHLGGPWYEFTAVWRD